jgi:hypothetical protein
MATAVTNDASRSHGCNSVRWINLLIIVVVVIAAGSLFALFACMFGIYLA